VLRLNTQALGLVFSDTRSFYSRGNCPKYLADGLEVADVPFLGATCDLVEPSHRRRLQTRFGWIAGRINHLHLKLDGISTAAHPALTLVPAFLHLPLLHGINSNKLGLRHFTWPGPDRFDLTPVLKDLPDHHREKLWKGRGRRALQRRAAGAAGRYRRS
jgi:hypothetical protein